MNSIQLTPSIGIVIPTWKGLSQLKYCLPPLMHSPLKPRILIIDSSSNDGTKEFVQSLGLEIFVIPKKEFNHGKTREWGRKNLATDIVVMMTQDAYATSTCMLEKLINPLLNKKASIAYAKQIPHKHASFFGAFARKFNYPEQSHIRNLASIEKYGVYTFFCSNSCAAYLNKALDEIDGFEDTIFGEDTIAVAKLLHRGHQIAYVSEAVVHHSHDYTLKQEFYRHLDIGRARKCLHHLIACAGKDTKRGKAYAMELIKELLFTCPLQIPYACLHILAKIAGYQIGKYLK